VLIGSAVAYVFYRYRVVEDAVQVKRGALFKQHLNLSFGRIQNISIEHPFYFRPLGLVTLKIDGAGSKGEEVNLAALDLHQARALRDFILRRKKLGGPTHELMDPESPADTRGPESEEFLYSRSVQDLILHGLTNNRAFIAVAAIFGFLAQSGFSPIEMMQRLGIEFDIVIAGLSLVRLAMLIVLSFVAAVGVIALLSVLVSVLTYYGFTIYRTEDSLTIRRTDGAASNNDLDMWEEMRLAAFLQKVEQMNPEVLPVNTVLTMATRGGATAIGMGGTIGSLEVGKRADLIQVGFDDVHHIPTFDVISHLVYVTDEQDVATVIVDGKVLMRDRSILTIDTARVANEARALAARIQAALVARNRAKQDP
jgi:membrane protein YdbS with pleckstrin-like domain